MTMGRPRKDSKIVLDFIRRNSFLPSREIAKMLKGNGIKIGFNTVLKRKKEMGIDSKRDSLYVSLMKTLELFDDNITVGELKKTFKKMMMA